MGSANPNIQDQYGRTALHYAGHAGDKDCSKVLLDNGAKKDISDVEGKTPLDLAKESSHHHLADILQESPVPPLKLSPRGTPSGKPRPAPKPLPTTPSRSKSARSRLGAFLKPKS